MLMGGSARELTLEAAQAAGSARTINSRPSSKDLPFTQIKKLLDSRNDREVLEGLRKVIGVRRLIFSFMAFFLTTKYTDDVPF